MTLALSEGDVERVIDALPDGAVPAGVKDQLPALIAAGLKLWAFDTRRADLGDNINVVGQPVSMPYAFLKTAAQAAIAQYPTVTNATYRDANVDGEPALRVGYTMRLDLGNGQSIKETGTQLYIPRTGRLLVITITTPGRTLRGRRQEARQRDRAPGLRTRHPADPPGCLPEPPIASCRRARRIGRWTTSPTLAGFDADAPLPAAPDPWDSMPTPASRPGPPWAWPR